MWSQTTFDIELWVENDLKEEIWCGNLADLNRHMLIANDKHISVDRATNMDVLQPPQQLRIRRIYVHLLLILIFSI